MTVPKSQTPTDRRQPFSELLDSIDFGSLSDEATHELNELVHACTETGKGGELTLVLKLKPLAKGGQVEIVPDIKVKKPKMPRGVTIMFATPENNLQREDPRQRTLDGVRSADEEAERRIRVAQ